MNVGVLSHTPYDVLMNMPVTRYLEYESLMAECMKKRDEAGVRHGID